MGMIERLALTAGIALIVGGLAVIYWPAALMVAGSVLVALAVAP